MKNSMSWIIIISLSLFSLPIESPAQTSPTNAVSENSILSKAILYIFTGSDWCVDCRRLEKNVLSDAAFLKTMEKNNIEVEIIDFPQRKKLPPEVVKHNESIAENYNFQGIFPTLILSQTKEKYEPLKYKNEKAVEFSEIVLEKLNYLNE